MNPPYRILKSYYKGEKFRWFLQVRIDDKSGTWYLTIGRTRFKWRLNRWKRRYGIEEF
jgi:hypothetical protein